MDYVCKKTAKKVRVLSRLSRNLTMWARIRIYKSIIAPHFDYCSSLLFSSDQSAFDSMQLIQNPTLRSVLLCKKLTPISFMLDALNWLSVKQRVYATTLSFIFKLKNKLLPQYLMEMVTYNSDMTFIATRQEGLVIFIWRQATVVKRESRYFTKDCQCSIHCQET